MSLVSQSFLELVRSRKQLERAYVKEDWQALKQVDEKLGTALNQAFEDEQRNTTELLHEMERILHLYAEVVSTLPTSATEALSAFPKFQP